MKEIGITGGIGSGKSTVARIFEAMGYQVYYADNRAKALYFEDQEVISAVKVTFGEDIYLPNGELDREKLAGIVFNEKAKLSQLNAIVHPAIFRDFDRWKLALAQSGYNKSFLLKEAAILFESGSHLGLDGVIQVYAPKSLRLQRVTARDASQRSQVLARMVHQWPDSQKIRRADFVIYNDGQHEVIPQVMAAQTWFNASNSTAHVTD